MSKILVIEDHQILRENIRELLQEREFLVETAMSVAEGFDLAKSFVPDLILCDMILPDNTGIDLLQKLKACADLKNIPVIIITGHLQKEVYRSAMTQGADDFIVKPFKSKDIFDAIYSQLSKAKNRVLDYSLIAELSEQSPLPILRIDNRSNIVYSNPAAELLLEKNVIDRLTAVIGSAGNIKFDFEFQVGERVYTCIASYNSAQKYHNLYFIDSTEQLRAFLELEEKNSLIERKSQNLAQFNYILAHDLKAPVINLRQVLDIIKQDLKNPPPGGIKNHIMLDFLNESLVKLETTMEDVSALLTVREQSSKQHAIVFSIEKGVKKVVKEFDQRLKEVEAKISFSIDPNIKLKFPVSEFSIIIFNLLDNAIKFRDPLRPLEINITAVRLKNILVLNFKDNGLGFDEKIAEGKLLVFYQKLHSKIEGKGLGLQIIRNILDNHSSKIEFKSQPGFGTDFQLTFKDNLE